MQFHPFISFFLQILFILKCFPTDFGYFSFKYFPQGRNFKSKLFISKVSMTPVYRWQRAFRVLALNKEKIGTIKMIPIFSYIT
jgi:hypothetical protein